MFYSHQLLSKKGQFGQIWIAATVHPKMNRKKTDQIDIQKSCMDIINPVVPLALRLSGILMGGIVRIYDHKVKFFYDDVTEFMLKMKTKPIMKSVDLDVKRPQRRTRAKYEAVTINGSDEESHDLEQVMFGPDTPEQEDDDYFVVPPPVTTANSPVANKYQADNEDITLEEDSVRSFPSAFENVEREESEDRFQQPENFIDDNIFMDWNMPEVLEPIIEEPPMEPATKEAPAEPTKVDAETSDDGPKSPEPQKPRKKRKPSKKHKKIVIDEEITEIPAQVFHSWLQDTSSIIYRKERRKHYTGAASEKAKIMLSLPSTFLSFSDGAPQSLLPSPLMEMWKMNLSREQDSGEERSENGRKRQPVQGRTKRVQGNPKTFSVGTENSPSLEGEEPRNAEAPQNFEEYGSVERLRTAVRTPVSGSQDDFFDNHMGFTPTFSGNSAMASRRRRSSLSEKLVPDVEMEYPTSGRSKRSRLSERPASPLGVDISSKDFFPEAETPDFCVKPPVTSQFESEGTQTQRDLDKLTTIMLQYLREHFINTPGVKSLSLDDLTEGMEASQAAKMFYHILVLASNQYLRVHQRHAYCEIIVGKGNLF